jgi:hypothetical protein
MGSSAAWKNRIALDDLVSTLEHELHAAASRIIAVAARKPGRPEHFMASSASLIFLLGLLQIHRQFLPLSISFRPL